MCDALITQFEITSALARSLEKFSDLKSLERMILLLISVYYPNIFPSQAKIAALAGCNRSSVNRVFQRLKRKGYLSCVNTGRKTNQYVFTNKLTFLISKDVCLKDKQQMLKYVNEQKHTTNSVLGRFLNINSKF